MTRRNRTKKQIKNKQNSNASGLFALAFALILALSLVSYVQNDPTQNWLGIIGYSISWVSTYLFGLAGYLIVLYLIFLGVNILTSKDRSLVVFRSMCYATALLCVCVLLNVLAESFPEKASLFQGNVYSENAVISTPYPHVELRFNLGGVPLYYLYRDLPFISIQQLLSNVGTVIIFSLTGAIFFFLFLGVDALKKIYQGICSLKGVLTFFGRSLGKLLGIVPKGMKTSKDGLIRYVSYLQDRREQKKHVTKAYEEMSYRNTQEITPTIKNHPSQSPYVPANTAPSRKKTSRKAHQEETSPAPSSYDPKYKTPSLSLLSDPPPVDHPTLKRELARQADILQQTLRSFGIEAKVGEINCGPTITSFEVHPPVGVKVQKIKALENDIALNLQAKSIRIIAPIPGKAAVGVEVPSPHPQQVSFKEMLIQFRKTKRKPHIPILLGKTVSGDDVIADLTKMPHCLIAGATGSGKSVCINTIVMSILMNSSPENVRLLMIDPKKVELTQYSKLPHMIAPVITEPHGAYAALQWLVNEMRKRYDILKQLGLRNISAFNSRKIKRDVEEALSLEIPEKMPYIVAIIDEFADLMMVSSSDMETPITRIAQMARAVGIHLILATQRPSREVITGIIKANFPTRIAFKVASRINSQIILDEVGAESLLGNGDLLFLPPGTSHLVRAQGAYISDEDIYATIAAFCEKQGPDYLIKSFDSMVMPEHLGDVNKPKDKLYDQALTTILQTKNASTTFLQRKLKIGYARAASLIDELEENGVIGPPEGSKPRRILLQSGEHSIRDEI